MKYETTIMAGVFTALCAHGQNLILNDDFEAGNTNFNNQYLYSPSGMYGSGTYCVVSNPSSVHPFWGSFGDHTTGSGLMLVANGNENPTNVVWRQTIPVASNTAYLFSAWAATSHPDNPSRFYFSVNGLQQENSVTLPGTIGLWQNYSAVWASEGAVEAVLEIRMLSTEYGGNDFVLDDLSFRSISSTAPPPPASIRTIIGEPEEVEVSWTSLSNQFYQVQWTSDLTTNQWFSLGSPLITTGTSNAIVEPPGTNTMRFYRVLPVN